MTREEADRQLAAALERHKAGDIRFAQATYQDVLRHFPEHATALHYLGLIAQQSGRSQEALRLLRRSIELDPSDPRAHNHLGQILFHQGAKAQARDCFERAVNVAPDHVDSLNSLANVLKSTEPERAIELYRRVLTLDPQAFLAMYNLANALRDRRAFDEAAALYERAIAAYPRHVHAHHNFAVLLEQQGRFEEAAEHYREALKLKPDHIGALTNLIALRTPAADAALLDRARSHLSTASINDEARIKLHQSLGKFHDRAGNYEIAFGHFAASKACVARRSGAFDLTRLRRYVDALIGTFSKGWFTEQRQRVAHPTTRPIFIVGMPRSGTTLAEQILASHPQVYGGGELQELPAIAKELRPAYPEGVATLDNERLHLFAERYLGHLDSIAPEAAIRVTDKLPLNFTHLGLIATLFPHACIVQCRRDPLDVGLSSFIEQFEMERDFTTDLTHFGDYFLEHERLMQHWHRVLPVRIHTLDYERLIDDPDTHTRALVRHCSLDWNDACLSFYATERAVLTPSRWQVRQPLYRDSVGRWRNYASQLEPLRRLLETRNYRYPSPYG